MQDTATGPSIPNPRSVAVVVEGQMGLRRRSAVCSASGRRNEGSSWREDELRAGFGARDRAENAAIAKKAGRTEGQPVGEMNSPGGRAGLFCRENAYGSVRPALAVGFPQ